MHPPLESTGFLALFCNNSVGGALFDRDSGIEACRNQALQPSNCDWAILPSTT